MAEDRQSGGGFPSTNWVLLAVAAIGAAYIGLKRPPLDVLRPDGSDRPLHDPRGIQDVAARLWQDPLDAVSRTAQEEEKDPAQATHRVLHSLSEFKKTVENAQLILGVDLSGAPYAEEAEGRRRSRYAVLAALNAAHYVPDDEEHIGYVRIDNVQQNQLRMEWTQPDFSVSLDINTASNTRNCNDGLCDSNSEKNSSFHTVIPFEWFHKADSPAESKKIVVMWIDEEILASRDPGPHALPLASLRQLVGELGVSGSPESGPRFALIGPESSTALDSLVREARTDGEDKGTEMLKKISIYNSGATVTGETIPLGDASNRNTFHEFFRNFGIHYYRAITTDDALIKVLITELKRRGVDPSQTTAVRISSDDGASIDRHLDHIAVVSEWDTFYGQSLPNTIQRCFSSQVDLTTDTCPATGSAKDWIHRFSYLRGLDGQVLHLAAAEAPSLGSKTAAIGATGGTVELLAPNANDNLEGAFGEGQFDYLRRLAERIRTTDSDLRRSGEGHIAAIGVLGSDVYDKLVILEALRPEFPDVLFFTTDLDDRLLTPGKSHQTRGLLVASSFGLNLRDAVQRDIPPFRNVYQTSTFLATRLAIQNESPDYSRPDWEKTKAALKDWLKPALFQVDRTGFFRLPDGDEPTLSKNTQKEEKACNHNLLDCQYIQPKLGRIFPDSESRPLLLGIASIFAIATIALAMCSRRIRQFCFPSPPPGRPPPRLTLARSGRFIGLSVGVFALAMLMIAWWPRIADILTQHGFGEPMLLLQGISIWPTIFLRMVSFWLCVWFIWLTLRSLAKNSEDTDAAMRLRPLTRLFCILKKSAWFRQKGRTLKQRLVAMLSLRPVEYPVPATGGEPPEFAITNFRVRFSYEGLTGPRIARALVAAIFMMSIGFLLAVILGFPNVPARGLIARYLYNIVTPLDVFATLLLVFLVVDATLYTRSFVILLSCVRSRWPKKTVQHYKNKLRMRSGDLDDWIDLQYLARRTSCITNLVYLPFVMMATLVITRNPMFDNFTYPPALVIVQVATVAIIVVSVFSLRRAADAARAIAVERLTGKLVAAKGTKDEGRTAQLELLLNRVENLRDGAFAPWSSQPIVRAFLLPLVTYGATSIVQIYAIPGL
jgi:hypothetical protein